MRCKACDCVLIGIIPTRSDGVEEDLCHDCLGASLSEYNILDKEYKFQEYETNISILFTNNVYKE